MLPYFSSSSRTRAPLFSINRWPVHMVTLLIAVHVLAMVLTTLCASLGHASWVNALSYNSTAVWHGQVLRLFTYAFVNPPSIWFALEMMMLYFFGREVERALGTKMFVCFYAMLLLLAPVTLQLLSLQGMPERMMGSQSVNFTLFVAFVAMYPTLPFLFGIEARWMLLGLITLSILQFVEAHQFTSMLLFLVQAAGAILFMAAQGYRGLLPNSPVLSQLLSRIPFSKKTTRRSSGTKSSSAGSASSATLIGSYSTTTSFVPVFTNHDTPAETPSAPNVMVTIDLLLEKISKTGMESLSAQEKELLEKASNALVERDRLAK